MQVLIQNNTVSIYPYSFGQLKRGNPQTSFPASPSVSMLEYYGVYEVVQVDQLTYDPATHRIEEGIPTLIDGVWTQVWNVISLTPEEAEQQREEKSMQIESQRAEAYRNESDPLFFKAQRGEVTQQEWLDKVVEIKARYL